MLQPPLQPMFVHLAPFSDAMQDGWALREQPENAIQVHDA
jgi:hypothetical protein